MSVCLFFFFFNGDLPLRQGIACTAVSLQIRLITTLKPPQKKKKNLPVVGRGQCLTREKMNCSFFFFDAMPTPALLFGKKARFFFSPHGTTFERSTVHSPLYGKKKRKSAVSNGHHFFFFHSVVSFVLQLKVYLSDTPFFFPLTRQEKQRKRTEAEEKSAERSFSCACSSATFSFSTFPLVTFVLSLAFSKHGY